MSDLKKLRSLYPALAELDDDQLVSEVGRRTGLGPEKVAQVYGGGSANTKGDFRRGVESGIDSLQATGYGLVGLAGDALERTTGVGESIRDFGFEGYTRNMEEVEANSRDAYSFDGATSSPGNFLDAAQYYAGRAVPEFVSAAVSGGDGAAIGKKVISEGAEAVIKNRVRRAVGDRIGDAATRGAIGSAAGIGAQSVGQSTGAIYGRAGQEATADGGTLEDVDLGRTAGYGLLSGAVESVGDIALLGAARFGPAKNLLDFADGGSRLTRAGTRAVGASATESLTEGLQGGIEDMGVGAEFSEAGFFNRDDMFAGAMMGGPIGAAGGALTSPSSSGTDLNEEQAAAVAEENAALEQQSQEEAAALQQTQVMQERATRERRDRYAPTFMSPDEFAKERAAQREAQLDDPTTELGNAFREWRLENDAYITDEKTGKKLKQDFLKQAAPAEDAETVRAEYLAALDSHAERVAALEEAFANETQLEMELEPQNTGLSGQAEMDLGDRPQANDPAAQVQDIARNRGVELTSEQVEQLRQDVEQIKQAEPASRSAAVVELVAKYTRPGQKKPKAAEAPKQQAPAKPEKPKRPTKRDEARAYAEEQLGENWEADNPELSSMIADGKSIYAKGAGKKSRFYRMVDSLVADRDAPEQPVAAEAEATPETPEPETPQEPQSALSEMDQRAETYARERLGDDWRTVDDELPGLLKGKRYAAFNRRVDELSAPAQETEAQTPTPAQDNEPQTPARAATPPAAAAFDPTALDGVKLSGNEQKVWDTIRDAFANNEQDAVMEVAGNAYSEDKTTGEMRTKDRAVKWRPAEIAKRAGLNSKQAAQTALTRLRPKLAKAYGKSESEIRERLAETGRERRAVEAAPDVNEGVSQLDPAELGEGAGMGTRASINQGAREGVNADDVAYMEARSQETNEVADQRAEEAKQKRREVEREAIKKYGPIAVKAWSTVGAEGDVAFANLSQRDQIDWIMTVEEYAKGEITPEDLASDQREMARMYDADQGGITMEDLDAQDQIESPADSGRTVEDQEPRDDGDRATPRGTRSDRRGDDAEGEAQPGVVQETESQRRQKAEVEDAEVVDESTPDTGVVGEQRAAPTVETRRKKKMAASRPRREDSRNVAQEISDADPTPKELRNQRSFKESYAEKDGRNSALWENPALSEVAEYADWLGSLTQDQWDAINPVFTNELNPFKSPASIDVAEAKATLQAAIDRGVVSDQESFDAAAKGKKPRFSVAEVEAEATGSTAENLRAAAKWLTGNNEDSRIIIVRAPEDLIGLVLANEIPLTGAQLGRVLSATNPFGFVQPDANGVPYAYFFSDNVTAGRERAAMMHEIGGHVGLDSVVQEARDNAYRQVLEWANSDDSKVENVLARRTRQRVEFAADNGGLDLDDADAVQSEYLAYFIEEAVLAGYKPTADSSGPLQTLLSKLWKAYKAALAKFTGNTDQPLFVEDFLDLARGAAKLEFVKKSARTADDPRFGVENPATQQNAQSQERWAEQNYGPKASQFLSDMKNVWRKPVESTKSMHNFIRDHKDDLPSAKVWFDKMLEAKTTRSSVILPVERVVNQYREMAPDRKALLNDFIAASTFHQKWGYDPKWEGVKVKVDPIMQQKFNRLSAEEKQIVREVFDHGRNMRQMMSDIAKDMGVSKFFNLDANIDGPYAPLKRFGNYVGELKSKELLAAEKEGDTKRIEKLKSDADHYVISFFDTMGAAQKFTDANSSQFAYAEASDKAVDFDDARPGGAQVYEKILGAINANKPGLDAEDKRVMADMVRDMYYQTLDESSARLSGARRLNRAGFDKDMMRAFAYHGRAQANLISQMKHGAEISEALIQARMEARKKPNQLMPIYNVLAKKFRSVMTPRSGALAKIEDNLLKFNTLYMLTSSIGYHVQNFTQPMYSAAKIAGDFGIGQYGKTWNAMFRGWNVASKVINTSMLNQLGNVASIGVFGKNSNVELDLGKAPQKYRNILRTLQLRDLLDVGVEEDLNLDNEFDTGYKLPNAAIGAYETITHRLYQAARYVEANNRIASAVAAYDLAERNPAMLRKMKMTKDEYVISVVEDTQGNFSQIDAPAIVDALPKMTTQFRKYQFMMAWLHVNAAKQAMKGESKEMRAAGRRTLGLLLANTGLAAGVTGVPMANLVMWAWSMMDDEEEPQDIERWVNENVEDERIATLIARGLPAMLGLDMSQKLSQNDIFLPYNTKFTSPEPTADGMKLFVAELALGPTGTLVGNFGNIQDFLRRGDYYRAAEYAMPRGLRSYAETLRYSERGYERRNNLVVADPRDFDMFDLISNATGLPSTEINKIKWTVGQQYELEQWSQTQSGRIRREYIEAYKDRDRQRMAELRQEWRDLQKAKGRIRPFFNNSPHILRQQPISNLLKAPREKLKDQRRYERQLN
jgi:gas vesicle protein